MATESNIYADPVEIYIGNILTAEFPEEDDTDTGVLVFDTTAWYKVGFTQDATNLIYEPTYQEKSVNESLNAIGQILTGEKTTLEFNIAEKDLESLSYAMGVATYSEVAKGASQAAKAIMKVGDKSGVEYFKIAMVGKSPQGYYRLFKGYKAGSMGGVTLAHNKEAASYAVKFQLFSDMARAAGDRVFSIVDMTDTPTS